MKKGTDTAWGKWEAAEAVFAAVAGTLLHFVYEWSGNNRFVAAFAPVNESVFEHLKLLFFPVLLFTVLQYFVLRETGSLILRVKLQSVLAGLLFIVVVYYCYTGVLEKNIAWLDISLFYGAVAVNSLCAYSLFKKAGVQPLKETQNGAAGIMLWVIVTALMICGTFFPPVEALPGLFAAP